jgi:hypothetical protein
LTTQSSANWSHPVTPCFPLLCSENQAIFPFCGTTSGQHFFKFCRLFRWLWCFPFAARTAIIPPQNRDIFNVPGTFDLNSKRLRKRQLRSSPLLSLTLRSATAQGAPGTPVPAYKYGLRRPFGPKCRSASVKNQVFIDTNSVRCYADPRISDIKGVAMAANVKTFGGAISEARKAKGWVLKDLASRWARTC